MLVITQGVITFTKQYVMICDMVALIYSVFDSIAVLLPLHSALDAVSCLSVASVAGMSEQPLLPKPRRAQSELRLDILWVCVSVDRASVSLSHLVTCPLSLLLPLAKYTTESISINSNGVVH